MHEMIFKDLDDPVVHSAENSEENLNGLRPSLEGRLQKSPVKRAQSVGTSLISTPTKLKAVKTTASLGSLNSIPAQTEVQKKVPEDTQSGLCGRKCVIL